MLRKSSFSLNGFLAKEQFAQPWSPHSLCLQNRQEIKRGIALLRGTIFAAYMVSSESSPWFTPLQGIESTKESSLGSPGWPRLHERGCWGIWYNEHCQAVHVPLGELLKWGTAFEENLPEEIALTSTNLYSSSGKVKESSLSRAVIGEQKIWCVPRNSPLQRKDYLHSKVISQHVWFLLTGAGYGRLLRFCLYSLVYRYPWANPSVD